MLDKFGSINLNQHTMDDCNERMNISSMYIVESNVISISAVNMMNVGKIDEKYIDILVKLMHMQDNIFMGKGYIIWCIRNDIHRIRTTDCIALAQPYRRVVLTQLETVKKQIDEWLQEGVVSKSKSEYACTLVVV